MTPFCTIQDCTNFAIRNGLCISHETEARKAGEKASKPLKQRKGIPVRSKKKVAEDRKYSVLRKEFLKDKICPIYPYLPVEDIHHKKGRIGELYLDTRYWLAVSRKGHIKIELNPEWAKKMGYSLPRI